MIYGILRINLRIKDKSFILKFILVNLWLLRQNYSANLASPNRTNITVCIKGRQRTRDLSFILKFILVNLWLLRQNYSANLASPNRTNITVCIKGRQRAKRFILYS